MHAMQILQMVWARRRIAALVAGTVFLLVAVTNAFMQRTYLATASLVVDTRGHDAVTGAALGPGSNALASQVDIVMSHNVALKVVQQLKLAEHPQSRREFEAQIGGRGRIEDWLADSVLKDLDVRPSREGNLLHLTAAALSPEFAASLANAFADAYVDTNIELRTDPARRQAAWLDDQLRELRARLVDAQDRLSEFQKESGIVGSGESMDVENTRLADLSQQLAVAQATLLDSRSRLREAGSAEGRGLIQQLPEIQASPLLQGMKADLARSEARLAEAAQRFGEEHPRYRAAAAEVASLRARVLAESRVAAAALSHSVGAAESRVARIEEAVEAQKATIIRLQSERNAIAVLHRDVESAQGAYDAALQRASQARLESRVSETSISVLNPALTPLWPARPRWLLNLVVGLLLGILLGVAVALAWEMVDRRIRSPADFEQFRLPVLAELPRLGAPAEVRGLLPHLGLAPHHGRS